MIIYIIKIDNEFHLHFIFVYAILYLGLKLLPRDWD